MSLVELFPIIALLCFIFAESCQLSKTLKERTVEGLSLSRYCICLFTNCLFAPYYIVLRHFLALTFNTILGILFLVMFILVKKYRKRNEGCEN